MEITLRDVIDNDLPIFFAQQDDPVANEMASFPARDRNTFMAHWAKIRADHNVLLKTMVSNGQVVGNILSFDMEGQREVGYWLGREFWGKGIASKAMYEFLGYEVTPPLYGVTVKHSVGSQQVLKNAGLNSRQKTGKKRSSF